MTTPHEDTVVSPELVLVDPGLAASARAALPDSPGRHARPTAEWLQSFRPDERPIVSVPTAGDDSREMVAPQKPRRRRLRMIVRATVVLAVAAAAIAVVVRIPTTEPATDNPGVRTEPPAGAAPARPTEPPRAAPKPATGGKLKQPSTQLRVPQPAPRRFAWAPSGGASGYHVELFRGSNLVFRTDTVKPQIVVPRRWRLKRRTYRLRPGVYRWYVWPRINGRRARSAIVQAKLVVPSS